MQAASMIQNDPHPIPLVAGLADDPLAIRSVSVIGLGYIGLPTACLLAEAGLEVRGVDVCEDTVRDTNSGERTIVEAGLSPLLKAVVADKRLTCATTPAPADVHILAVPTPVREAEGDAPPAPDLTLLFSAARALAPVLRAGDLVVIESTSPVGATANVARIIADARPDLCASNEDGDALAVDLAFCPERVLPGDMLRELRVNDRIIGGLTPRAAARAVALYKRFQTGACHVTTAATAELVKLVENASRDVQIAFANELSILCDKLSLNVWEVIRLANCHPRVKILNPGAGVGGHCIAVDPWFIIAPNPDETPLMAAARRVNDGKPHFVVEKLSAFLDANPDLRLACLGLSYKANVDDFRESPALEIALEMTRRYGKRIVSVDPYANKLVADMPAAAALNLMDLEDAQAAVGALAILTGHAPFRDSVKLFPGRIFDVCGLVVER